MSEALHNLTDEQQSAFNAGPLVALAACAGAGKTRVLIARISKLIADGADPAKVVAITYTRKAAAEIVRRLREHGIVIGFVGTVHSWLLNQINSDVSIRGRYNVCPQELFESMVKKALADIGSKLSFDMAMEKVDDWKYPMEGNAIRKVRMELELSGLIDYEQILRIASNPQFVVEHDHFKDIHLLVDEFQDTGPLERRFYEQITPNTLMIVGDRSQTLYGFRGADPSSIERMAAAKGMESLTLSKNFRCSDEIQEKAARALGGDPVCFGCTDRMDLRAIAYQISQYPPNAILCGTNATVDRLTIELKSLGLEVTGRAKVTEEQKDLEAYIAWSADGENELLLVNMLRRIRPDLLDELRREALEKLCSITDCFKEDSVFGWPIHAELRKLQDANPDLHLYELAELAIEQPDTEGRVVMTIHGSKGMEWDSVAVVDDMGDSEHHRRMRYVAFTRARKNLSIYRLQERWGR